MFEYLKCVSYFQVKAAVIINDDVFPYALIAIAIVILILGVIGIIYICISWSK